MEEGDGEVGERKRQQGAGGGVKEEEKNKTRVSCCRFAGRVTRVTGVFARPFATGDTAELHSGEFHENPTPRSKLKRVQLHPIRE